METELGFRPCFWCISIHTALLRWRFLHNDHKHYETCARRLPRRARDSTVRWMHVGPWNQRSGLALNDVSLRCTGFHGNRNLDRQHSAVSGGDFLNSRNLLVFVGGTVFGFGLAYSGMTKQEVVLSFLGLRDLGLVFVLGGAAAVASLAINILPRYLRRPLLGGEFKPRQAPLSRNVLIGAAIFGLGWGISGQCPGSAVASLGTGNFPILAGLAAMFAGAYVRGLLDRQ